MAKNRALLPLRSDHYGTEACLRGFISRRGFSGLGLGCGLGLKKPRMPGILSSENRMTLRLLVLSEYQHVTDGHVAYVHVVLKHS